MGWLNLKTKKPISPRTMFELASVSKTFTATAVLILHDREKLSIDDDVLQASSRIARSVHRRPRSASAICCTTPLDCPTTWTLKTFPKRHKEYWVNEDYLRHVCQAAAESTRWIFRPDAKYDYNNTNFMLLALDRRASRQAIVRKIPARRNLPLRSAWSTRSSTKVPKAVPDTSCPDTPTPWLTTWRKKKVGVGSDLGRRRRLGMKNCSTVGDGAVWTNLEDMHKWDIAVRAEKLLKPATWKLALTPSKTRDGKTNDYGLGWGLYYDKPSELYGYGHDGSWGGFQTTLTTATSPPIAPPFCSATAATSTRTNCGRRWTVWLGSIW